MFIEKLSEEILFEMRIRLNEPDWIYWTHNICGYIEISPGSDLPMNDTINSEGRRFVSVYVPAKDDYKIYSYDRVYINSFISIDEIKQFVYPKFKVANYRHFTV